MDFVLLDKRVSSKSYRGESRLSARHLTYVHHAIPIPFPIFAIPLYLYV